MGIEIGGLDGLNNKMASTSLTFQDNIEKTISLAQPDLDFS